MPGETMPIDTSNPKDPARTELALELAGIGTWELNINTNQLMLCSRSRKLMDITGGLVDLEYFLGQIHPNDRILWSDEIQNAAAAAEPVQFSFEFRLLTAEANWLMCKGQAVREGDNIRLAGALLEVTSEVNRKHQTLRELAAGEAKFKALIDQAPVATCLFVGEEMTIELANAPMIKAWGKDESVIGKPLHEALPELIGQPFMDILQEILKTGMPYSSKNARADLVVDGKLSTFYFDFTYKPIFDSEGKIYGIIDMAIDITAQVLMQKALEESEAKLRAVIASAPAAIGLFEGRDLIVQLPNQTFIDIVGKGPDIEGIPLREVMPELDSQPFLQILDDVYTSGVTYQSYGTRVDIVRQGVMTNNYYDITYSPVYDNEGKVYAILDIAIDVTERVSVEKQVEQSQRQLLSLFEQSPIGIAMIEKENLVFTMANPFYGTLVGRKPEDIIGKKLLEALPEIDGQGFDQLLKNVIATGIPYISKEQPVDLLREGVLKTIYVDLAYQPQRDMAGEIIGVLVVATDLTEQVLTRKKIEETQSSLRGAIELAELGTYLIELDSWSVQYSDRLKEWYGLQGEHEVTLEKVFNVISENDLEYVKAVAMQAIAPGSVGRYDLEYTLKPDKTGISRILHTQGQVLYDESGKPKTMLGTVQDVTVQRQIKIELEREVQQRTQELEAINEEYIAINEELSNSNNLLQQSNTNLQQFAYVASHDLQEPLRKIQSFSDLLMNRYKERIGDGGDYLIRMQRSAKRMSVLIEDLLSFSRITSQNDQLHKVSLKEIFQDILGDLELPITETAASVTIDDLPEIQGGRMQLTQLFSNLLSNALKFRKPDVAPVIKVSARIIPGTELPATAHVIRSASRYHEISVADNGIGFDQQYAERIFQLFQRLHGRSEYSGTGIGLAICERVAANHGGGISANGKLGEGSTFTVFLPVR